VVDLIGSMVSNKPPKPSVTVLNHCPQHLSLPNIAFLFSRVHHSSKICTQELFVVEASSHKQLNCTDVVVHSVVLLG